MDFDEYEWDDDKEIGNIAKHGVSFDDAMYAIEDALENYTVNGPFKHKGGEIRYEAHGDSQGRPLVVFFTIRDRKARIISARRRA